MLILVALLGACSGWAGAALDGFSAAWRGGVEVDPSKLVPGLRYLEVEADGTRALLVLGNVDPDPEGPIEVWYSADKAVLRLQGGRLVGLTGAGLDWNEVVLSSASPLSEVAGAYRFVRTRTEMPGYRHRVDVVEGAPLSDVPDGVSARLKNAGLRWVGESVAGAGSSFRAVYGFQAERQVYGRQCFADRRCISWQPVMTQAGARD